MEIILVSFILYYAFKNGKEIDISSSYFCNDALMVVKQKCIFTLMENASWRFYIHLSFVKIPFLLWSCKEEIWYGISNDNFFSLSFKLCDILLNNVE